MGEVIKLNNDVKIGFDSLQGGNIPLIANGDDLDNYHMTGIYVVDNGVAHAPFTPANLLIMGDALQRSGFYATQLAIKWSSVNAEMAIRTSSNGAWTAWRTVVFS